MIEIRNGNLLESGLPIIAHQTNCLGVMGAGIAKQIKLQYPEVYTEYKKICDLTNRHILLGTMQDITVGNTIVVNLFGQSGIKSLENGICTNYDALQRALSTMIMWMKSHRYKEVGIPYKLGCGLAGGDWDGVVYPMLQELFNDTDITLYIYKFK